MMKSSIATKVEVADQVPAAANSKLAKSALWFNTWVLGIVLGACCGAGLITVTLASVALTGENAGYYLNLLGIFFPGYSATVGGAWVGGFWAFLFAGLSSATVFQVYARAIRMDFGRALAFDASASQTRSQLVILISPRALGIAIGTILAVQLFLSTTWLVVTGRAAHSPHAALLSNYLPFYSVSLPGALIGAVGMFIYGFVFAYIFASIYNVFVKK